MIKHLSLNYVKKTTQSGQAMMIAVVFFVLISLAMVLGVATPILKQVKDSTELVKSKQTYYLAEGSLEDALYRVRTNKTITTGDTVAIGGSSATLTLTTTSNGKTIDAVANVNGRVRKMEAQIITGTGASFNYGVQSGNGGFTLKGGSRINGNVYSNGNIIATNGVTITGSAVAANSSALTADQMNDTPATPPNSITFGNANATQDVAESFQISTSSPVNYVRFYIKKVSTPANATVRIVTDNAGSPSTTVLDTATLGDTSGAAAVTTSYGWVNATFSNNVSLSPGTTYWLVIDSGTNSSKYYILGANTSYALGLAKIGQYSGTWSATSPSNLDPYFDLYLGGFTSTIGTGTYSGSVNIGTGSIGDAWAHTVSGASVAGNLYCQVGTNNSKACNTTHPDPSPQGLPLSSANIAEFKSEAAPGTTGWAYTGNLAIGSGGTTTSTLRTINGNLTVSGGGTADIGEVVVNGNVTISGGGTLKVGPMKVNGNLTVGSSGMTIKGTIWVTGTFSAAGGASVRLDTSYGSGSGVIVVDGTTDLTGGANFYGSGVSTSFPMLVSTSICPVGSGCGGVNAIEFSGGAGAVVLNAQSGSVHMSGGSGLKSVVANEILVDGGSTITYDSGLANMTFSSGPSGGWNVSKWQEVQ